jgi:hypothetical protein
LASSASFEAKTATWPRAAVRARGRVRPAHGVHLHRAFRHLPFHWMDAALGGLLCLLTTVGWALFFPWVCRGWRAVFELAASWLKLNAQIELTSYKLGAFSSELPYLRMASFPPDLRTWWLTAAVCIVLLVASYGLPARATPLAYLLRFAVAIQASALIFFALVPARFPHGAEGFLSSMVATGAILITLVPVIFGLIYYVFDFGILRKALLTWLTMAHLAIFLPLQCLLQACILQKSILFMPVLYILFGVPLNVFVIVSFYSWGMSWNRENQTTKDADYAAGS